MINRLTGPFTGLISKIPGIAPKKPVETKTQKTAFACLSRCTPCGKKPVVVTASKRSMVTLAKNALNKSIATSKQFAVAHKKLLIGATALGLAGAAGYVFKDTLTNLFSQSVEIETSSNRYTLPIAIGGGAAVAVTATYLALRQLAKSLVPGYFEIQ